MEDRFKVRAWVIEQKRMVDCILLETSDNIQTTSGVWYKIGTEAIPMQCAGAKDKHGTLIYESDVVYDGDYNQYTIAYCDSGLYALDDNANLLKVETIAKDGIVVGHIYKKEQPINANELLRWLGEWRENLRAPTQDEHRKDIYERTIHTLDDVIQKVSRMTKGSADVYESKKIADTQKLLQWLKTQIRVVDVWEKESAYESVIDWLNTNTGDQS